MKTALMHRKMDYWTEYNPLADSYVAATSFSPELLIYSKQQKLLSCYAWMKRTKYLLTFIRLPMMIAHGPNR
jgi:hypothetical protein